MAMSRYFGSTSVTSRSPIAMRPEVTEFEARHHPERRGLAAARGAEQDEELAVVDLEVETLDHLDGAERLDEFRERDAHRRVPSL